MRAQTRPEGPAGDVRDVREPEIPAPTIPPMWSANPCSANTPCDRPEFEGLVPREAQLFPLEEQSIARDRRADRRDWRASSYRHARIEIHEMGQGGDGQVPVPAPLGCRKARTVPPLIGIVWNDGPGAGIGGARDEAFQGRVCAHPEPKSPAPPGSASPAHSRSAAIAVSGIGPPGPPARRSDHRRY